jgi:DNA-binding CsgD family transcriptional regulator
MMQIQCVGLVAGQDFSGGRMSKKGLQSILFQRQSEGDVAVDLFLIVGVLGFSFFFAWLFLLFSSTIFSHRVAFGDPVSLVVHICLALGTIAALFAAIMFSRLVFILRSILPVFALLLSTANLWAELTDAAVSSPSILYFTWAMTGVGVGLLVILWGEFISLLRTGQAKLFFSLAGLLAMIWIAIALVIAPQYQTFLVFLLPFFSLLILLFQRRYFHPFMDIKFIDPKTSLSRMHMNYKPVMSTIVASVALGFMLSWFIYYGHNIPVLSFILVLFIGLVTMVMIADAVKWKKLGENFMMRTFLLFVAVGMLPPIFISDEGRAVCCVIMVCGMVYFVIHGNSALSEHIHLFELAPMYTVAFGRVFSYLGILLGYMSGYVAFWTELFGNITLAVVTVFLMVIFVLETVFIMMENNYPLDEARTEVGGVFAIARRRNGEQDDASERNDSEIRVSHDHPGIWKRKCEAVADAYGLSSRQREVLFFLAKGRNAEYITQALVISLHTAKAHIYNIYQKMGVHSRQELIDIIENIHLDAY